MVRRDLRDSGEIEKLSTRVIVQTLKFSSKLLLRMTEKIGVASSHAFPFRLSERSRAIRYSYRGLLRPVRRESGIYAGSNDFTGSADFPTRYSPAEFRFAPDP